MDHLPLFNLNLKTARSLMQLRNNHCRWPCGDPKTKDFYFCGDPSADLLAGQPYCLAHGMIAYGR